MKKPQSSNRGRPRKSDSRQTTERILNSAEELFGQHGFQGVSLRAITSEAGVNVALIKYYFGNKINLLNAVIERRAEPIIVDRNRLLDACAERARETGRLDVREVLEAYIGPILLSNAESSGNDELRRMFGLAFSDSSLDTGRAIHRIFQGVATRFIDMLREACPDLSDQEFNWRLVCVLGGMIYLLAEPGRVRRLVGPAFDASDKEAAMACAMPFLAAGMSAPPATSASKRSEKPHRKGSQRASKAPAKHASKPTARAGSRA